MYIVNTTFIVDFAVHESWLNVIKNMYIPFIKEAGFNEITLTRVISIEAAGEFTYSLQVGLCDLEQYHRFSKTVLVEYDTLATPIFGEKVVLFTTLLKKI